MKTIYLHRNKINNKVYIGQTVQPVQKRWRNGAAYSTCTYFYNAIQKYGWDNFDHIILEQSDSWTKEELNEKEEKYIEIFDSTNPKYGYNIKKGSTDISPNASKKAVEWMKAHPEFGLARAKDMHKWQQNHSKEILQMRRINAAKATEARKKKVRCIETGEVFESATDAARKIPRTSQAKISMVCSGKRNTCGGYHWCFVDKEKI